MAEASVIIGEYGATDYATADDDGKLDVTALVRMFEESEESTLDARKQSERDRDYVDNKQLTDTELKALALRKQPPMIDNRIKTKIDYLVGLEKQQRIDPKALPRTPAHEQDADGATQGLRYVSDAEDYDGKRSAVWRNLLVEGAAGMSVSVKEGYGGVEIILTRIAWDRMFWDPHSSALDFDDAAYLGLVRWDDYDNALRDYGAGAKEALDITMASVSHSQTYDDKPKFNLWADKKRKRVRICQIWIKRGEEWHFAEFTKGGILKAGPSPYKTDKGESDCELFFQSAYVDRDNNRFGLVREMITLQDGINKRQSKALHLLNTTQVMYEDGFIDDIEAFRREANRPDGAMKTAPGGLSDGRVKIETRLDLAQAQMEMLQDAKNSIDLKGPNATQMGDKAQGSAAASGRAILASQQGGMISLGDLLDSLRHLDKRVFRAIWNRIRQYWTAEKWIRVTDDERNVKWVGINVDPMRVQMAMQQDPSMQGRIAGVVASVAELDCDIIIDEAPDNITPATEQWQGLVDLAKSGVAIPPKVLILAAPNLRDKDKLIGEMEKAAQNQQPSPEIAKTQVAAQKIQQDGQIAAQEGQLKQAEIAAEHDIEWRKALLASLTQIEVARIGAKTDLDSATLDVQLQAALGLGQQQHEAVQAHQDRQHEAALTAAQISSDHVIADKQAKANAAQPKQTQAA